MQIQLIKEANFREMQSGSVQIIPKQTDEYNNFNSIANDIWSC
jgi:hypothetical protein